MDKESKLEEEILASFEREEWRSVPNLTEEIARYASIASASLAKDKRVNIRISSRDLEDIQAKAAEEGIPYQTLMASILHKSVTGRLVETPPSPTPHPTRTARKPVPTPNNPAFDEIRRQRIGQGDDREEQNRKDQQHRPTKHEGSPSELVRGRQGGVCIYQICKGSVTLEMRLSRQKTGSHSRLTGFHQCL
jgi:predicted DNA binding CopG/RHH family protein